MLVDARGGVAGALLAMLAGCSANAASVGGAGRAGSGGADGGVIFSGGGAGGGAGSSLFDGGAVGDATTNDPDAACQTVSAKGTNPPVDIIWAVDTSGSMTDEIAKIRQNINASFVQTIEQSPIDWQVIMLARKGTTDLSVCVDPPLGGAGCGDNPPRFHHIDCDVESNDALDVLAQSYTGQFDFIHGLSCRQPVTPWKTLARPSATKVFLVVTDDEAEGLFSTTPPWQMFDDAATADPAMFGGKSHRRYVFHGIIGRDAVDPSATCSGATNSAVAPGVQYQQLAQLTSGMTLSICEDDWSKVFQTIAKGIVDALSCEFDVPPPTDGGAIDPAKVNVAYTAGGASAVDVLQDGSAACNAGADGWQWDATQTKILLCGPTCDKVKADPLGSIDIVFGCQTKVRPPS